MLRFVRHYDDKCKQGMTSFTALHLTITIQSPFARLDELGFTAISVAEEKSFYIYHANYIPLVIIRTYSLMLQLEKQKETDSRI